MHDQVTEMKGVLEVEWITYLWVSILSLWGGCANYVQKLRSGTSRFNLMEIFGELIVSGFAGVLTFFVCAATHTPEVVTAVCVGISGHMGARIITTFEVFVSKKLGLPTKDQEPGSKD